MSLPELPSADAQERSHQAQRHVEIPPPSLGLHPDRDDYCYRPCRHGLHVCGIHPDGVNCMTVANFPVRSAAAAKAPFEEAKQRFASRDDEPDDLVVDLQRDWDCEEDFVISRQMLQPLADFWGAVASQ